MSKLTNATARLVNRREARHGATYRERALLLMCFAKAREQFYCGCLSDIRHKAAIYGRWWPRFYGAYLRGHGTKGAQ